MAELSGLDVAVMVAELKELQGSYISGIYSARENQILRLRRSGGGETWVVVSPRYGVWVSKKVTERGSTTEFTSKLRGEIERLRIAGAEQTDLDRIFNLTLGEERERRVIVELMPPGNIVVTDGDGKVVLLMREVRSERRRLVRGSVYSPPAQSRLSPADITGAQVTELLSREKTVGRAVGRNVSLPRKYIREVLARMGVEEESPAAALLDRAGEAAATIRGLVEETGRSPNPSLCPTAEGDEVFVVKPTRLEPKLSAASMGDLCDQVFLPLVVGEMVEAPKGRDRRAEIEATVENLRKDEKAAAERAAAFRAAAEKVKRSSSLGEALRMFESAGGSGREHARPPASREAAASVLFGRAKEFELKSRDSAEAASRLAGRLDKEGPREASPKKLTRRSAEWYEKFRWFFTSEGKLAVGGRDAQSNELLVKRHLENGDTVYHADLFGSPFFVLKDGGRQSEPETQEVAKAVASFSSAWKTGLAAADAYWVSPEQVSTSAPSGEFLARGSFVIRGKKNFVTKNPVEVSLGVDDKGRVMAGPESAVMTACRAHITLIPHREKASDTAKKALAELRKLQGNEGQATLTLDEVLRALPSGGGKIIRRRENRRK